MAAAVVRSTDPPIRRVNNARASTSGQHGCAVPTCSTYVSSTGSRFVTRCRRRRTAVTTPGSSERARINHAAPRASALVSARAGSDDDDDDVFTSGRHAAVVVVVVSSGKSARSSVNYGGGGGVRTICRVDKNATASSAVGRIWIIPRRRRRHAAAVGRSVEPCLPTVREYILYIIISCARTRTRTPVFASKVLLRNYHIEVGIHTHTHPVHEQYITQCRVVLVRINII